MADKIPLIEPVVGEEELENVRSVIESGYMTQGPYANRFEESFAEMTNSDHAITATSCTTGMEMALEAVGVGRGDEVIIPDFTHPATGNAVVRVGADPVIVDVDPRTYNIDPQSVEEAVSERTTALLPVSWGGQPLDAGPLLDIASAHGLAIVEDAACSAGASFDGTPVGSQFDASVFSFHPRKVLTTGEGGMVTTDDESLAKEMRLIKNFGTNPRTDVGFVRADATNYRLSDVLAAIGVAQLEKSEEILSRRREIAEIYTDLLDGVDGVVPPTEPAGALHTYQSYCVYVETGDENTRDELIGRLADDEIETQIGTYALHATPAFEDAKRVESLENSRSLFHRLLTLPVTHSMKKDDVVRVVDSLDEHLDVFR